MTVYTSYFSSPKVKQFDGYKISIARYGSIVAFNSIILAPPESILREYKNEKIDFEVYKKLYLMQLEEAGIEAIKKQFQDMLKTVENFIGKDNADKDIVLLCYEKNPKECHRSIFADWWQEKTGEIIKEL